MAFIVLSCIAPFIIITITIILIYLNLPPIHTYESNVKYTIQRPDHGWIKEEAHTKKMEWMEEKIHRESNSVVKGDLEIELLKLKIIALEKELKEDKPFEPTNYS